MAKQLTPELAAQLTDDELAARTAAARERVETRFERVQTEHRDLSTREAELTRLDRDEMAVLAATVEARAADHGDDRVDARGAALMAQIASMVDTRPDASGRATSLLVSDGNLAQHAAALEGGRPYGAVETRARVTAGGDLGSAGAWDAGTANEPQHLLAFAGIPVSPLTGKTAQVPVYGSPGAGAGVDETANHPEYDTIDPANLSALRYGRWTEVSSVANQLDDLRGINAMHAWGIARDLDALVAGAIQTAAGSAAALTALEAQVRGAILQVAANTYSDPTRLVIFGRPDAIAALTGFAPTNGSDTGSLALAFNGARVYPTNAAAANRVTVFDPKSFRAFQSQLQSASLIDPSSGANKFGSWLHSTSVAQQIPGSAASISTVGA